MERETLSHKRTADAANRLEKRKIVRIEGTEYGTFHAFYEDDILYAWTSISDDTRDGAAAGLGKVVESAGEGSVPVAADLFEDTGF